MTQDTIPDDVMALARRILDEMPDEPPFRFQVRDAVAAGIMADRQRSRAIPSEPPRQGEKP